MKKIAIICMVFVLLAFSAAAQEDGRGADRTGQGGQDGDMSQSDGVTVGGSDYGLDDQGQGEQTANQGESGQMQVRSGNYVNAQGQQMQVQVQSNNMKQLQSGGVTANTNMEMVQEQTQEMTKLMAKLSNGKNAEIKVMPNTASEKALERLRVNSCNEENECQIELKEVGSGEQVKAAYEVKLKKEARFLALFKTKMQVQAQVDAESGEVIKEKKAWWAFLAAE